MSTQVQTPEIAANPLPLKGKYDKRRFNGRKSPNPNAKPQWAKNLSRNTAAKVLKQKDAQELWSQLLDAPDLKLRFEVLRYLTDRLEGRPFVAENPNVVKQVNPIMQDQRLQIAVQQLNIMQPKAKAKRVKQLPAPDQSVLKGEQQANPQTDQSVDEV